MIDIPIKKYFWN